MDAPEPGFQGDLSSPVGFDQSGSQLSRATAAWPLLCFIGGAEEASRDTGKWQLRVGSRHMCKMTGARGWENLQHLTLRAETQPSPARNYPSGFSGVDWKPVL